MLVTKHAAELCALLVNDLYGELPSRILVALFTRGRSTFAQLGQYTAVAPRYLRNALSVLIQQNLLFHSPDADSKTTYEVNADACYSIVRFGKILQVIESQHGVAERDLVQTLLLLGFASVADLTHAYQSRQPKSNGTNGTHGHTNGAHEASSGLIESDDQLHSILAHLIQAEIVEAVHPTSFRNPTEVFREIERDLTHAAPGEKASTKIRSESADAIAERFKKFRDERKNLKRELDLTRGKGTKRRKLQNGFSSAHGNDIPQIRPNAIVRVNHEKCLVELRNQRLATFASDTLGSVTGEVYYLLLGLLTHDVPRCRGEQLIDEETPGHNMCVSTMDVFYHVDESLNLQGGIGKAPRDKIDVASAQRIRPTADDSDSEADDSDMEQPVRRPSVKHPDMGGEDMDDDEDEDDSALPNGNRETKVKFEDGSTSKSRRVDALRQHLFLLAESKPRFIRHVDTREKGMWTVDFDHVLDALRESELDSYIEQSFGRHGLRLTRILREKGKLDEKMLPAAALMKKSDVQLKMTAMQMAGLVDVQEVPKDNSRLANRSLFFWYFDRERIEARIVDDVYKAMVRCLQTLQVERHRERNILSFVDRKDVKGKEEEVMTAEHYNKYNRHLEVQEKLLGQVLRLDDMVAILREF